MRQITPVMREKSKSKKFSRSMQVLIDSKRDQKGKEQK